ncbi:hypothetical protein HKX48_005881 [Thoreauomyces humboldtii]|nr:hypothetical protein HKX48_005881 [Thoreauomyces humboldtii]
METADIADPLPLGNAKAQPLILLRNAIALQNYNAAVTSFELVQTTKAPGLAAGDLVALIKLIARTSSGSNPHRIAQQALEITTTASSAGLVFDAEASAALVQLWAKTGDIGAAVRAAHTAVAAGPTATGKRQIHESLVVALAQCNHPDAAAKLMTRSELPTAESYAAVIKGFAENGAIEKAVATYDKMIVAGMAPSAQSLEALIHGYAAIGRITSAHKYFDEFKKRNLKQGTEAFTGMIRVHAMRGNVGDAVDFYRRMREAGVEASAATYAHLIRAYAKQKDVAGAVRFFHKKELIKGFRFSLDMYAAMIETYASVGQLDLAWRMLGQALPATTHTGIPTKLVAPLAADAIGKHPDYVKDMLRVARIPAQQHASVLGSLVEALLNSPDARNKEHAITMYRTVSTSFPSGAPGDHAHNLELLAHASSGDLAKAILAFKAIRATGQKPDASVYLELIKGYAANGEKEAINELLTNMTADSVPPNLEVFEAALQGLGADTTRLADIGSQIADSGLVASSSLSHPNVLAAVKASGKPFLIDTL